MATVAVIGRSANQTNLLLVDAWRALGLGAVLLTGREARGRLVRGDVALGRIDVTPAVDGVEPGLLDLLLLERSGLAVLNGAGALLAVHDKLRTARRLEAAGLPHPRTGVVRTPRDPLPVSPPLVLKPRFGSWGTDVHRCQTAREARRLLHELSERPWFRRHGALVQELVPGPRWDLRLVVARGEVVGAGLRTAAPGEWRTNFSLGGRRKGAVPDEPARALASRAARCLGADLVGVDLLPLPGAGYLVLELNGAVDFDELYAFPGRSVFGDAARALGLDGASRGRAVVPRNPLPATTDARSAAG
jgi:ribosomal protein S6--L-glutamate ligase